MDFLLFQNECKRLYHIYPTVFISIKRFIISNLAVFYTAIGYFRAMFKVLILSCSNELTELNLNKKTMKNLFKIAFVAMLFVHTVKAQEVPEVENTNPSVIATPAYYAKFDGKENEFKMRVLLTKREGDKNVLKLILKDKDGNPIFSKYMDKSESQSGVILNLEDLADGKYIFELSNKYGTMRKTYLKETSKPVFPNTKQLVALN
jgi:hypothetical protein